MTRKYLIAMGDIPPIHPDAVEMLRRDGQVEVLPTLPSEEELAQKMKDVDAVFLGAPRITRKVILSASRLKVIARCGIGVDNIDIASATDRGVVVTNMLDVLSRTVAEHAIMLMLAVSRELVLADTSVRTGLWREFAKTVHPEICGKTLGIIGLGAIGCAIAEMARGAFGMRVITNQNPHLKPERVERAEARMVSMDELLRIADYVVLSVPLTPETREMIGERELAKMKTTGFIINVARGNVIDEVALYRALRDRRIAGAGLDVLAKQPPDPTNPLLGLSNVILTPHCAAITAETGRSASIAIAQAVLDLFNGHTPQKPINVLNPEIAERFLRTLTTRQGEK